MNLYVCIIFLLLSVFCKLLAFNEIYTLPTYAEILTTNGNHGIFINKTDKGIKATISYKLSYGFTFLLNKIEGDDVSIIELPVKITDFNFLLNDNENITLVNKRIFGDKIYIDINFKPWLKNDQVKQLLSFPVSHGGLKAIVDCEPSVHKWCGKTLRNIVVYNQFKMLDNEEKLHDDIIMLSILSDYKNKIFLGHTSEINNDNIDSYTRNKLFQKSLDLKNNICKKGLSSQNLIVCKLLIKERGDDLSLSSLVIELENRILEKQERLGLNIVPELFDENNNEEYYSRKKTSKKESSSKLNMEISIDDILNFSKMKKKDKKRPTHPEIDIQEIKKLSLNSFYDQLNNPCPNILIDLIENIKIERDDWKNGGDIPVCPPPVNPLHYPVMDIPTMNRNYDSYNYVDKSPFYFERSREFDMDSMDRNQLFRDMNIGGLFR